MFLRRGLVALAAASGCIVAGAVVAAAPAHADTAPWTDGTVFVAASGMRHGYGGGLYAVAPNGSRSGIGYGSAEDVAVAGDGTVFWVECSGGVYSYNPLTDSYPVTVTSGLNCPNAVAVEPDGHLLVSDFYHLYEMNADGTGQTTLETGQQFSSLAVDPAGDIYAIDGSDYLEVRVAGSSTFQRTSGLAFDGQMRSIRLAADSSLVVAEGNGAAIVPLSGAAPAQHDTGYYSKGAVIDEAGDLWISTIKDDPSTQDEVDYVAAGDSTPTPFVTGFDTPGGLAVYPAPTPPTRTASSITVSRSSINVHREARLTATVDGGAAPDGLVQFAIDGNPVSTAVTVSGGTASTWAFLPKGTHNITATYLGSGSENPSQSAALPYTLRAVATTTTVTAPSTTVPQADPVTVTATVTGSGAMSPTGEVDFYVNGHYAGYGEVDGAGQATATVQLPAGSPTVTAKYTGDDVFAGSSGSLAFTTTAPYTSSTRADVHYGTVGSRGRQGITLVVTVTGRSGGPRPTGTVTADTGFTCSAMTPMTSVRASRSTCHAVLRPDYYDVSVDYSGDATYAASSDSAGFYAGGGG